jgi:hypothetical protein
MGSLSFKKAVREQLWTKVLLSGTSGSGKTFTALRLATGLASKAGGSGIAYIDTENRRASYYANEFDFDVIDLEEPYTPEKYIEAIDAAVDAGYKVLCIDGISSCWKYLNDVHDNMPGNSFTNWGKLKPRYGRLMEKILQSKIHIIATARGKDAYVLEDKNGKQTPKKVGEGIIGDKELEYNYTCSLQLEQDTHVASVMKDNTHIFEGRYEVLSEKDGVAIYDWANSGEIPVEKPVEIHKAIVEDVSAESNASAVEIADFAEQVASLGNALVKGGKVSGVQAANIVRSLNPDGTPNIREIKDMDVLTAIYNEFNSLAE